VPVTQSLAQYVPAQLRAEMARREISKVELARKLGKDETWVGKRMRGRTAITMADLDRIAAALDVPLSYFIPEPECAT
jgi:transcriptional regulator with XRE-family HTH domain